MSKPNRLDVSRRVFLRLAGTAAVGGVCFTSTTMKQALAAARRSGKPLFTEANLNALLPKKHDETFRRLAQDARRDIRSFIRQRFYLTSEQEGELASLSEEIVRNIQASLDDTLNKRAIVRVVIKRNGKQGRRNHSGQGGVPHAECKNGYVAYCTSDYEPPVTCTLTYTKC
jgi:hypothetical protein